MMMVWTDAADAGILESATNLHVLLREEFRLGNERRNFRNAAGSSPGQITRTSVCMSVPSAGVTKWPPRDARIREKNETAACQETFCCWGARPDKNAGRKRSCYSRG